MTTRRPPCRPGHGSARRRLGLLALLLLAAVAVACQADPRRGGREARRGPGAADGDPAAASPGGSSGGPVVELTDLDLAPMDGYIRRRFWVLGDDVEIVASKEYFIQNLSITARTGFVRRKDDEGADQARSVLTFLGRPEDVDYSNAPRVLIGTGISVLARRTLTIRFVPTKDPALPVRIRIAANGDARLGTGQQVTRRDASLVLGAQLRRAGQGYVFEEQ